MNKEYVNHKKTWLKRVEKLENNLKRRYIVIHIYRNVGKPYQVKLKRKETQINIII